ncbi:hypothetical protein N602_31035 [Mycobacterium avium subsp. hominissuis 10-5606]|nr:hypothetical protein N602_31035 [Mycobacterium avium subsp. hominissuis 10-5606]
MHGVDDAARVPNTEFMPELVPRQVVIAGFPGVQALDVVGPHDVFSGASLLTGGGYQVVLASVDGQPVTTPAGLGSSPPRCRTRADRSTPSCCPAVPASTPHAAMPS